MLGCRQLFHDERLRERESIHSGGIGYGQIVSLGERVVWLLRCYLILGMWKKNRNRKPIEPKNRLTKKFSKKISSINRIGKKIQF